MKLASKGRGEELDIKTFCGKGQGMAYFLIARHECVR